MHFAALIAAELSPSPKQGDIICLDEVDSLPSQ